MIASREPSTDAQGPFRPLPKNQEYDPGAEPDTDPGVPNGAAWLTPTQVLDPRILQISAQLSF